MKIRIHPGHNALYYSYYLWGLSHRYGWDNIEYMAEGFPKLHHHCLSYIINDDQRIKKVYISAGDGTGINQKGLEWCDIYGKVNIDPTVILEDYLRKVTAIGPGFGIQFLSFPQTLLRSFKTYVTNRNQIDNAREHFANYYRQFRYRLPIDAYVPDRSENTYIFFAASLWSKEAEVNQLRASFVDVCRSLPGIDFEGGFPRKKGKNVPGFESYMIEQRYSMAEYIEKTQRSAVVFNTSAVQNCLGWKLGEFLALGKAIISTPLSRKMPTPLEHGIHVHYLDDTSTKSLYEAVKTVCKDDYYRKQLEEGARYYYMKYLHPERVLARLHDMNT